MREGDRVTEPAKVDVTYEGSGYDTLTLRAVATVATDKGKKIFRGSWVNDGNVEALMSLVSEMARTTLKQIDQDRLRHSEESDLLQRRIIGLQAEIDEMRNEATKSGLAALRVRSKEVLNERNLLQAEVTELRAKLARIYVAVGQLIGAVDER
jgi:hypothetical protein